MSINRFITVHIVIYAGRVKDLALILGTVCDAMHALISKNTIPMFASHNDCRVIALYAMNRCLNPQYLSEV
jgi:hypothetical protein